jgi:hypothetical protein
MTTAVPVLNHPQIRISPNPVYQSFKINGVEGLSIVSVIDMNGKTVSTKHVYGDEEINICELSKGPYIIRLINNQRIIQQMIIKE